MEKGRFFIISGPSGAGKTTLAQKLVETFEGLEFSVSYATRRPRPGEIQGVDYNFVDDAKFDKMVKGGEFLEYAVVHGKRYGTRKKDLEELLLSGKDVLLDIDVCGAEEVSKKIRGGTYIFVLPPSMDVCMERLKKRGITQGELEKRFNAAMEEIKRVDFYGYIIINQDLERAFEELNAIITAERLKKDCQMGKVKKLFNL